MSFIEAGDILYTFHNEEETWGIATSNYHCDRTNILHLIYFEVYTVEKRTEGDESYQGVMKNLCEINLYRRNGLDHLYPPYTPEEILDRAKGVKNWYNSLDDFAIYCRYGGFGPMFKITSIPVPVIVLKQIASEERTWDNETATALVAPEEPQEESQWETNDRSGEDDNSPSSPSRAQSV